MAERHHIDNLKTSVRILIRDDLPKTRLGFFCLR